MTIKEKVNMINELLAELMKQTVFIDDFGEDIEKVWLTKNEDENGCPIIEVNVRY